MRREAMKDQRCGWKNPGGNSDTAASREDPLVPGILPGEMGEIGRARHHRD
jgi:hypothetical protein